MGVASKWITKRGKFNVKEKPEECSKCRNSCRLHCMNVKTKKERTHSVFFLLLLFVTNICRMFVFIMNAKMVNVSDEPKS